MNALIFTYLALSADDIGVRRIDATDGVISSALRATFIVIGALAVLFIIIGGIRYILSNGDQSQIAQAKNTVLYAVVGLIVSLAATAIISFVGTTLQG